jgi:LPS sulfotransferase NodH
VHPHGSYLIFATPRSGSYLLCEALIKARLAGHPTEYFGPVQTNAIMKHLGTSSYTQCLAWILAQGTTPNGVFGGKIIWNFYPVFVSRLRECAGYEKLPEPELLSRAFTNLDYIWITRRDKVRQAISYSKALQTNVWVDLRNRQSSAQTTSNEQELPFSPQRTIPLLPPVTQELTFDFGTIEGLRQYLEQCELDIEQYFATCGIQPFKVVYEDFVDAYEETVLQILDYLRIPALEKLALGGEHTVKRQANEESEEWLQRYYQLKQQDSQGTRTMQG